MQAENTLPKETGSYTIRSYFAKRLGIPTEFNATKIAETERAIRLKGEGIDRWFPKSVIVKAQNTEPDFKATKENKHIICICKYGARNFSKQLNNIKTLSGRKWNPDKKVWSIPIHIDAIEKLQRWGFDVSSELAGWLESKNAPVGKGKVRVEGLYPFQNDGVAFIESRNGRALIGDEMGLGKTIQALAWLNRNKEKALPAVIICPASIKLNWKRETKKWIPGTKIKVLSGRKPDTGKLDKETIYIINYDILSTWTDYFKKIKTIIIDESHYCKQNRTLRTKAVKVLSKRCDYLIALSGTPIVNRPIEFWNIIEMLSGKEIFGSRWAFVQRYCDPKYNGWGWDLNGSANTEELHNRLTKTLMLRRLKQDVLKDLPAKQKAVIPIEMNTAKAKEYKKAENNFIHWIKENKGKAAAERASNAKALSQIETLKQLAIQGKMESAIEWIQNFLDSGEKLVVFATHKNTINTLMKRFEDIVVKIDGSIPGQARQEAVDRFQNNKTCKLFVGSMAATQGITLTASSCVCFLELFWQPGIHAQAEDRIHRIGQKNAVNIYYLISQNTIEKKIMNLLDKKAKAIDSILDGIPMSNKGIFNELLDEIEKSLLP